MRFIVLATEYEISSIKGNNIRSARAIGGRTFNLEMDKFFKLYKKDKLKIIDDESESENDTGFWPDEISEEQSLLMNYRLKYVREVMKNTIWRFSHNHTVPIINKLALEIKDPNTPSSSSVIRWVKAFIESSNNPMSLLPAHKMKGNRSLRLDPVVEQIINTRIKKEYLTEQKHTCHYVFNKIYNDIVTELADGDQNEILEFPSERTIERRIKQLDLYTKVKLREGKYKAAKQFKAAGKSLVVDRALEFVEADGNLMDVLIVDEDTGEVLGRPYGTCLIDVYSRCVISFFITMIPFSSATLIEAIKLAVSRSYNEFGGVFENLIVDNGCDYKSISIKNICRHLGTHIYFGAPKDPNSKPHVERFFGTLNSQLIHQIPGTTFSNHVMKGDYQSEKYAHITLDKLNEFVSEWLENVYHKSIHKGHKRAPKRVWEESVREHPVIKFPMNHLEKISRIVASRHISQGRVTYEHLKWYSHALATMEREMRAEGVPTKVNIYIDPFDLSQVYIEDINDKTITIKADSTKPEYTDGLTLYEHLKIVDDLKKAGQDDLASLGDHELQIARCRLWEKIVRNSEDYSKKQIARIKEANKSDEFEKTQSGIDQASDNQLSGELNTDDIDEENSSDKDLDSGSFGIRRISDD